MGVSRRADHTLGLLLERTVAAQIHGASCVATFVGMFFLLPAARSSGWMHFWGSLVFGLSAMLVFGTSAAFHFLNDGYSLSPRLEALMEKLDHFAIYGFIAGSYTPFLMNAVSPTWRGPLLVAIWGMAFTGISYTAFRHLLPSWMQLRSVYTFVYVLMGWTLLVRAREIITNLSLTNLSLLIAGCAAYSVGAVIFATRWPKRLRGAFGSHEIWHVLVSVGFAFHYFLILNFYSHPVAALALGRAAR